jgi:hypothetical protein
MKNENKTKKQLIEEVFDSKGEIGGRLYISKSVGKKELIRRIKEVI